MQLVFLPVGIELVTPVAGVASSPFGRFISEDFVVGVLFVSHIRVHAVVADSHLGGDEIEW